MKKMTKKLALSRETLRTLETSALGQIAAGDTTTVIATRYPSCNTYCDITMGC
jgi:hypothetical protein